MFGPQRDTYLCRSGYELVVRALEYEIGRLKIEAKSRRDAYDRLGWAKAKLEAREAHSLWRRLDEELRSLPAMSEDEDDSRARDIRIEATRMPRSAANAAAHKADSDRRKADDEARRVRYWERVNQDRRMNGVPEYVPQGAAKVAGG